ncbi:hypothetical protein L345_17129, partial [Ophiophagus hannah]
MGRTEEFPLPDDSWEEGGVQNGFCALPRIEAAAGKKDGRSGDAQGNFLFRMTHRRKTVCRADSVLFPGSKQQLEGELRAAGGRRVREQNATQFFTFLISLPI